MADVIAPETRRSTYRDRLHLPANQRVVALLPGSRQSELQYHADTFIRTAVLMHEQAPDLSFLVPLATRETRLMFEQALYAADAAGLPMRLLFGHAHDASAPPTSPSSPAARRRSRRPCSSVRTSSPTRWRPLHGG